VKVIISTISPRILYLPHVQEAMIEAIRKNYGNPSSQHQIGDKAATALAKAREQVARLIQRAVGEGGGLHLRPGPSP